MLGSRVRNFAAKTAVKSTFSVTRAKPKELEADMPPLQPFSVSPTLRPNIPDVTGMSPHQLGIRFKKHWDAPFQIKMRGIDVVLREQHEADPEKAEKWTMFTEQLHIGSVVRLESVTSRTVPRKMVTCGVVTKKAFAGIASHYTILSLVNDSIITLQMPLYSPNVISVKILGQFDQDELAENGLVKSDSLAKIYADHEKDLRQLAEQVKQQENAWIQERTAGKKVPTRKVMDQRLKSVYDKGAKEIIHQLRQRIKAHRRGQPPNKTWKGWLHIEDLRLKSF